MNFADLQPRFVKRAGKSGSFNDEGVDLAAADGIIFLCPRCYETKGRTAVGVHSILCWRPSVPANEEPGPGRWDMQGTSITDLSLSPSVNLPGGCRAHFWVKNGFVKKA